MTMTGVCTGSDTCSACKQEGKPLERMQCMKKGLFISFVFIAFCFVYGCSLVPSENVVKNVIVDHFEARMYTVEMVDIGEIELIPLHDKKYMAPKGFVVTIRSIVLEVTEDIESPVKYRKGDQLRFNDGTVTIRESSQAKDGWVVSSVSGIEVP